jgi:hypothetical protein
MESQLLRFAAQTWALCAELCAFGQAHYTLLIDVSAMGCRVNCQRCAVRFNLAPTCNTSYAMCRLCNSAFPCTNEDVLHVLCFFEPQKTFSTEARKKGQQQQQQQPSSTSSSKHKKAWPSNVVSSTALTPGTPFMHDVCVSCCYYICARLANRKWQQVSSIYELGLLCVAAAAMAQLQAPVVLAH